MFKVESDNMPAIYCKADSQKDALQKLKAGLNDEAYFRLIADKSFTCVELTPEQFVGGLPDEFRIEEDTSF